MVQQVFRMSISSPAVSSGSETSALFDRVELEEDDAEESGKKEKDDIVLEELEPEEQDQRKR